MEEREEDVAVEVDRRLSLKVSGARASQVRS
jgi:hypothetical protein